MAKYKRNDQLVTSYDRIKPSQVVLGQVSPERYVSAQPSGYEAVLHGSGADLYWAVGNLNRDSHIGEAFSVKEIKQMIAESHNKAITDTFAKAAVAWVDYYQAHPLERARANPQLIESIYKCASRAKLHPKDEPVTTATAVQ